MLQISHLFIYPIKSLGDIELQNAKLTDRGLEHDRRWMLVDQQNQFLTQRSFPRMALLKTAVRENKLIVFEKDHDDDVLLLDLSPSTGEKIMVDIWEDQCEAYHPDTSADLWFSNKLLRAQLIVLDNFRTISKEYWRLFSDFA
jgi:hypothetical protein